MATIYRHMKLEARTIDYAGRRICEIDNQMDQLKLERELLLDIQTRYRTYVCPTCAGQGTIMKPIEGCECDGPRQHPCPTCATK